MRFNNFRITPCNLLIIFIVSLIGFGLFTYQQTYQIPNHIKIATGSELGAYYKFAKKYQEIFKEHDIDLEIVTTAGSVEALKKLNKGEVDVAFVQGGTADSYMDKNLVSLASVFYEPLWVFHNQEKDLKYLNELKGKKVSIGKVGSGSHAMFKTLLKKNGLKEKELLTFDTKTAIEKLKEGTIDAFCIVISPEAPVIIDLLKSKNIKLMSFQREVAYKDRFEFLNSLKLSEGVIDLESNSPEYDVKLLGTTASLVTKEDLNSDLQRFIIKLIKPVHTHGGIFEQKNYFPSINYVQLPISEHTKNYLKNGDSWMEKFLPFWLASLIENFLIIFIPLIPLMIIYSKVVLPSYVLHLNHKIYLYNNDLRNMELYLGSPDIDKSYLRAELVKTKTKIERDCFLYFLKTHVYYAVLIKVDTLIDTIDASYEE